LHWDDLGDCQALFGDYLADLKGADWAHARRSPRSYDFVDGVAVSPTMRRLYRDAHQRPTQLSRSEILAEMLQLGAQPAPPGGAPSDGLSALMRRIHASRTDLQSAFDLAEARGAQEYRSWFWASGVIEHGLGSLVRRAAQMPEPQTAAADGKGCRAG
jgi:hypothetical protein